MILNKPSDLIDKKPNVVFRKFRTEAIKIKELKLRWSEKMTKLQEKSFTEKDIINLKLENQKLKDLEFLRSQIPPGLFTKPADVNSFMKDTPESKDKNNRMFIEIRFHENTPTTMSKNAEVFRLKKNHQNIGTSDYALNLCQYLDQARDITGLSMGDLRNVLNGLQGISTIGKVSFAVPRNVNAEVIENMGKTEIDAVDKRFKYGEHIACVWAEAIGDSLNWHLGVVYKYDDNELYVSYMQKTDKKGKNWIFPEEAEIRLTQSDQIIVLNIPVKYSVTAMMRCSLDNETLSNIQECFFKVA